MRSQVFMALSDVLEVVDEILDGSSSCALVSVEPRVDTTGPSVVDNRTLLFEVSHDGIFSGDTPVYHEQHYQNGRLFHISEVRQIIFDVVRLGGVPVLEAVRLSNKI